MREDLKRLAEDIILVSEKLKPLEDEGVVIQHFRVEDGVLYVALIRGIEKVANMYGFKNVNIEDGIVRITEDKICFYQYVLERDRKQVFNELKLI